MQRGNVSIRRAFTLMVAAINAGGMSSTGTRGRGPLDRPTRSHRRPRALAPWCAINGRPSRNGKLRRNQWPVVAREPVGNGCVVPQEIVDQSKWTPPQRRFSLSLSLFSLWLRFLVCWFFSFFRPLSRVPPSLFIFPFLCLVFSYTFAYFSYGFSVLFA